MPIIIGNREILIMNNQETCFDCNRKGPEYVFYSCNVCDVIVCWDCIGDHYPVPEVICPDCAVVIPKGDMCSQDLTCPQCSNSIHFQECGTCPEPHLISVAKTLRCSKCGKEGCDENIRFCGFTSKGVACDQLVCFDCGFGCIEDCDMVRCCIEHTETCRECGCTGARCGQCQRQFGYDREPKCIDCIRGDHPGEDGDTHDYVWSEEDGRWKITPKSSVKEDDREQGFWVFNDFSDEFGYEACDD